MADPKEEMELDNGNLKTIDQNNDDFVQHDQATPPDSNSIKDFNSTVGNHQGNVHKASDSGDNDLRDYSNNNVQITIAIINPRVKTDEL